LAFVKIADVNKAKTMLTTINNCLKWWMVNCLNPCALNSVMKDNTQTIDAVLSFQYSLLTRTYIVIDIL